MSHHLPHDCIAARGDVSCAGAAMWLDSGIAPGLVLVDSNRPAGAGIARGLLTQSGVAH